MMHIGICSPITIREFLKYLPDDRQYQLRNIPGLRAPAVDTLVHQLLLLGHRVTIFTLDRSLSHTIEVVTPKLSLIICPYRKSTLARVIDFFHVERKHLKLAIMRFPDKIDVLHAHWTYEFALGAMDIPIPLIITVRDWAPKILRLNLDRLGQIIYRSIRYLMNRRCLLSHRGLFISNSSYIAEKLKTSYNRDSIVIANPVSNLFFCPRRKDLVPLKAPRIISVTQNLGRGKNIVALLRAFQIIRISFPDAILTLVGASFSESNIEIIKWKRNGWLQGVELLGLVPHDELPAVYHRASVLVHPSLEESFGNTLIEAMASGVPVVAGIDSGAVASVLDNGNAGVLCNVKCPVDIAEGVIGLLTDVCKYHQISIAGLQNVYKHYSAEVIARETIDLYKIAILKA